MSTSRAMSKHFSTDACISVSMRIAGMGIALL
jgi:hypothetical protein